MNDLYDVTNSEEPKKVEGLKEEIEGRFVELPFEPKLSKLEIIRINPENCSGDSSADFINNTVERMRFEGWELSDISAAYVSNTSQMEYILHFIK